MAFKDEDTINFAKLERELAAAVAADEKYDRENDAKFRAVNQKVATYEEFKEIVAGSHLKALAKDDNLGTQFQQQWNIHASSKPSTAADVTDESVASQPSDDVIPREVPRDGHAFHKTWKTLSLSASKYKYLSQFPSETISKIFRADISFGLLGEFLKILNENYAAEGAVSITSCLEGFGNAGRFGLSRDFLSAGESELLKDLFGKLSEVEGELKDKLDTLRKLYKV